MLWTPKKILRNIEQCYLATLPSHILSANQKKILLPHRNISDAFEAVQLQTFRQKTRPLFFLFTMHLFQFILFWLWVLCAVIKPNLNIESKCLSLWYKSGKEKVASGKETITADNDDDDGCCWLQQAVPANFVLI